MKSAFALVAVYTGSFAATALDAGDACTPFERDARAAAAPLYRACAPFLACVPDDAAVGGGRCRPHDDLLRERAAFASAATETCADAGFGYDARTLCEDWKEQDLGGAGYAAGPECASHGSPEEISSWNPDTGETYQSGFFPCCLAACCDARRPRNKKKCVGKGCMMRTFGEEEDADAVPWEPCDGGGSAGYTRNVFVSKS